MPSPTETLLRVHDSPVPTHTVFGRAWSIATAPIDWQYLSKTGLNVVPPSTDFHTPPPAEPTYSVRRSPSRPSIAAMRPDMVAGPIARSETPPNVSASILISSDLAAADAEAAGVAGACANAAPAPVASITTSADAART